MPQIWYERDMMRGEPATHELVATRTSLPIARVLRYCCSRMGRYNDYPRNDERGWLWHVFGVEVNGPDAMVRHALVANAGAATRADDGLLPAPPAPSQSMISPTTSLPWPSAGMSGTA